MAQAAKAKPQTTKSAARAKTLKPSDSKHAGETAAERQKRLDRNAYVRQWRKLNRDKKRGLMAEPQRVEHDAPRLPAATTITTSSPLASTLHISSAAGDTTTLGDVRSALKVLIQTQGRATDASDHARGIVEGLRMALSMLS